MTPNQIKNSSLQDLIIAFKNKGRSLHAERKANAIWREIKARLPSETLTALSIAWTHLKNGEGADEFNQECDILLASVCK